jgi:hypothetical protein
MNEKTMKEEKAMMDAFKQLSASGRVDVLSHTHTVLKAENGVRKEYEGKNSPAKTKKSAAKAKRKSA